MINFNPNGQPIAAPYVQQAGIPANVMPPQGVATNGYQQMDAYTAQNYYAPPPPYGVPPAYGYPNTGMVGGLAGGISSVINTIGSIFSGVYNIVTGVLGAGVNLVAGIIGPVVNLFTGIFGGIGGGGGYPPGYPNPGYPGYPGPIPPQPMPMPPGGDPYPYPSNNLAPTRSIPPPPPGAADVNQAYGIVMGDLAYIQDPNMALQTVTTHAQRADQFREQMEYFATHRNNFFQRIFDKDAPMGATQAAEYALQAAQKWQNAKSPQDQQKYLDEINRYQQRAVSQLRLSEDYAKAVYNEALYTQRAGDILFTPGMGRFQNTRVNIQEVVNETWGSWMGQTQGRIIKRQVPGAMATFNNAYQAVNQNLAAVQQILSQRQMQP